MADLNIEAITEEWKKLRELFDSGVGIDKLKEKFNQFGADLSLFKSNLPQLGDNIKSVSKSIGDLSASDLSNSLSSWSDGFDSLKEKVFAADEELGIAAGKMLMLSGIATKRLPLPDAFKSIGDAAASSTVQISKMLDTTLKLLGPELSTKGKGIAGLLSENAGRADFAKNFESGFLMAASASGEFSEALRGVGTDLSGLSQKSEAYSNLITNVANVSGLSGTKVGEYAAMLRKIPGALDNFNGTADSTVRDMHYLDAAIKVAAGTGQSFETVMTDLSFSFDSFGTHGKKALEEVARMQSVSDAIGLPMSQMRQYTQSSATEFKLLGDNVQGAIDIMARFGPAFRESGMGPEAIKEVVGGITQGISRMGTAQKAFLSAQTGGASGLQGAFQIDLALKQGNLGDVYKKVESNLKKQFGGNVVTLEQAATDSRAAGQYQKQVQYLRSPAMGGIAKDEQSAMRILDAFSKGQGGKLAEQKTPDKALGDALKTGDKLQERQNSLLTQVNNWAERQAQIQSIIAYNTSRLAGNDGPLASYLKDLKKDSTLAAKELKPVTGQGMEGGRTVDDVMRDSFHSAGDKFAELKDQAKGLFENFEDNFKVNRETSIPNETRTIATPTEYAARSVTNADKLAARNNVAGKINVPVNQNHKVDVAVTTVCSECQRKIAREEAGKISKDSINHYHRKGQVGDYHAGQTMP
jgi:hypothetical protein